MQCAHFIAGRCQSCQWLAQPYATQLANKQQQLVDVLAAFTPFQLLAPIASSEQGFRYKAKMVVLGTAAAPLLGIVNQQNEAVDLADCPLYPERFADVFAAIKDFIVLAKLQPYQVQQRRGELKFILLSQSQHSGRFMLRFVLRSKNHLAVIQKYLPRLLAQVPALAVVSINLQPQPAALLEGAQEIVLTAERLLREQLNQVPLYLSPQSFFQTNPSLAAALYATAATWAVELQQQGEPLEQIWDLFCGVGGFGLHLASQLTAVTGQQPRLTGIEIAAAAIASAEQAASELGLTQVGFQALDSAAFAHAAAQAPDLLVVNPPRRGLGDALCADITRLQPRFMLYSSCNVHSLAADIARLKDYRLVKAQLFDLFAHSSHAEVLTLLIRR
ncbi:23S rRNA (uracil(747)-C(5))-methyltransferase RlmC [Rheinheimera sp. UJ63]|uniref:23S rRNA (uracil(747)-C(5))-methyltransferase RlmC n=1 Tax=Rheinheimera sp. UJ63 TaxID=2910157 RepID=UPI001F20A90C|nr:23S rRNA (uracil(747)-C(5))-methyltransferase RlmC [Rheinheimera sp. UJ63]MCF4009333.1 23S rRNA (uracil(747)-C(5))-methyltransferase RlmC [Rheinheimera sp. UJ63]